MIHTRICTGVRTSLYDVEPEEGRVVILCVVQTRCGALAIRRRRLKAILTLTEKTKTGPANIR